MNRDRSEAPRSGLKILGLFLPRPEAESIAGDYDELFEDLLQHELGSCSTRQPMDQEESGAWRGRRWPWSVQRQRHLARFEGGDASVVAEPGPVEQFQAVTTPEAKHVAKIVVRSAPQRGSVCRDHLPWNNEPALAHTLLIPAARAGTLSSRRSPRCTRAPAPGPCSTGGPRRAPPRPTCR